MSLSTRASGIVRTTAGVGVYGEDGLIVLPFFSHTHLEKFRQMRALLDAAGAHHIVFRNVHHETTKDEVTCMKVTSTALVPISSDTAATMTQITWNGGHSGTNLFVECSLDFPVRFADLLASANDILRDTGFGLQWKFSSLFCDFEQGHLFESTPEKSGRVPIHVVSHPSQLPDREYRIGSINLEGDNLILLSKCHVVTIGGCS